LASFVSEHAGKTYEDSLMPLVKAKFKTNKDEDFSKFFCSELVAAAFKHLGLLSKSMNASNFTPKDFASEHVLLNQAELGPIIK